MEPSPPACPSPPLSRYPSSAACSILPSPDDTSTHSPARELKRDSSLSGSNRLKRPCISRTQAHARFSRPRSNPTPSRWQEPPSASNLTSSSLISYEAYVEVTVSTLEVR